MLVDWLVFHDIFSGLLPFLPHSAYLKIWKVSVCKIGHGVALFSEGTNQPANQPVPCLLNLIFSATTGQIFLKFGSQA
jgi:hypothetical protein